MALYWQRKGDTERALKYITAAAEIDPNNPNIQVDLGAAIAREGDLETAESHYLKAVELTAKETFFVNKLVEFYLRYNIDIREKALPLARENVLLNPDDPSAVDTLGQVLFRLNDLFNAERFYSKALDLRDSYAPAHLHLGILYNLQGKHGMAKHHLTQAIAIAPGTSTSNHAQRILDEYSNP
jgi:Flp pilus assembly protein TadD